MTDRRNQGSVSNPNPSVRYYRWSSDDKTFTYYDPEVKDEEKDKMGADVSIKLPLKFALLTERSTVRGWHDATESSIYANEVELTSQEELNVYSSKKDAKGNSLIASGLYNDIKTKLEGGHFEKAIYGYEKGVGIVRIALKGSGLTPWFDLIKEVGRDKYDLMIEVTGADEQKKGKIKYSTPIFEATKKITKAQDDEINEAFGKIDEYFKSKKKSEEPSEVESNVESGFDLPDQEPELVADSDDLPF